MRSIQCPLHVKGLLLQFWSTILIPISSSCKGNSSSTHLHTRPTTLHGQPFVCWLHHCWNFGSFQIDFLTCFIEVYEKEYYGKISACQVGFVPIKDSVGDGLIKSNGFLWLIFGKICVDDFIFHIFKNVISIDFTCDVLQDRFERSTVWLKLVVAID